MLLWGGGSCLSVFVVFVAADVYCSSCVFGGSGRTGVLVFCTYAGIFFVVGGDGGGVNVCWCYECLLLFIVVFTGERCFVCKLVLIFIVVTVGVYVCVCVLFECIQVLLSSVCRCLLCVYFVFFVYAFVLCCLLVFLVCLIMLLFDMLLL